MASHFMGKNGKDVLLRLSFRETEALEALLRRVGEETNEAIYDATIQIWDELRDAMQLVESAGQATGEFEGFAEKGVSLLDTPEGLAPEEEEGLQAYYPSDYLDVPEKQEQVSQEMYHDPVK